MSREGWTRYVLRIHRFIEKEAYEDSSVQGLSAFNSWIKKNMELVLGKQC